MIVKNLMDLYQCVIIFRIMTVMCICCIYIIVYALNQSIYTCPARNQRQGALLLMLNSRMKDKYIHVIPINTSKTFDWHVQWHTHCMVVFVCQMLIAIKKTVKLQALIAIIHDMQMSDQSFRYMLLQLTLIAINKKQ